MFLRCETFAKKSRFFTAFDYVKDFCENYVTRILGGFFDILDSCNKFLGFSEVILWLIILINSI